MSKRPEIAEEWKALAPGLELPRNAPFSLPSGYFEALPEETLRVIKARQAVSMEEEGPVLSEGRCRHPPYTVPAGYFGALPAEVLKRVKAAPAVVPLKTGRRFRRRWLTAAAVAGIIAATGAWWFLHQAPQLDRQLARLPDRAIERYLEDHTDLFDQDILYDNLSGEDFQQAGFGNMIGSDAIREYLEDYDFNNP